MRRHGEGGILSRRAPRFNRIRQLERHIIEAIVSLEEDMPDPRDGFTLQDVFQTMKTLGIDRHLTQRQVGSLMRSKKELLGIEKTDRKKMIWKYNGGYSLAVYVRKRWADG